MHTRAFALVLRPLALIVFLVGALHLASSSAGPGLVVGTGCARELQGLSRRLLGR